MIVYGLLSVGIQLHLHYCCGKISKVQFFEPVKCCGESEKEDACSVSQNCCRYEEVSFKIDDTHTFSTFKLPLLSSDFPPIALAPGLNVESDQSDPIERKKQGAPPGKVPIYLAQQSLLYYA